MSDARVRPIRIAVLAMGGEGGGVLADWIVDVAEHQGGCAQTTSVPGVAQRTGATIYYVEAVAAGRQGERSPVLALMPTPGDVDVVIASELMEAARAVQRGLVTPEKTTLIASAHRVYTLTEKMAMGDGRVDGAALRERCTRESRRIVLRDFAKLAEQSGSVISATLFGALAASGTVPWPREAFEAAIRRGGVGVEASLRAFDAAYRSVAEGPSSNEAAADVATPAAAIDPRLADLWSKARATLPPAAHAVVRAGLFRTADYQGRDHAAAYLDRVTKIAEVDARCGDGGHRLLIEGARHLALWMAYEDTARVAELKLRASRFARVGLGEGAGVDALRHVEEYLHPGIEELADVAPAAIGRWMLRSPVARALLGPFTGRGRVVRTSSLSGFLMLYLVASCRSWRPRSLRFTHESSAIAGWIDRLLALAATDYALACELAECPRLLKGYSDTLARGRRNYQRIVGALDRLGPQAADRLRALRDAALADETGAALERTLTEYGLAPHA
jgi:indolepyruvate ferredoxin oxidoreductase beta subunit